MMRTDWGNELALLEDEAQKIQKRIVLVKQLAALESGDSKAAPKTPKAAPKPKAPAVPGAEPKKRGRPRKVQPEGAAAVAGEGDGKAIKLPALLKTIGQSLTKPVTMVEIVNLVREAGYKSDAKDYANMVYQGLTKLVDKGLFTKTVKVDDPTTRIYEYVPSADAA